MIPYRQIEHTADVGLEIYGSSIEELFINSVKGLFHLITSYPSPPIAIGGEGRVRGAIKLEAPAQEELLVHWLNEFIYNFFVKGFFPQKIGINALTEKKINAKVDFVKYRKTQKISLEIKAATYHDLSIRKVNNKYQTRVIFDV